MGRPDMFSGMYVLGWAVDDKAVIQDAIASVNSRFNLTREIRDYKNDVFDVYISDIITECGVKINLGGQTDKQRIITSDKPNGVFDFSLAAKGLYRPMEYYCQRIADEFPDKFKDYEVVAGIVPSSLVKERVVSGNTEYYYEDSDGFFICTKQQRGQAAVDAGIQGAKLDFATKTKKVYLTFKRNRGKVKYVEIYSLFYYSSLQGDVQYAIRHLPAMMVAKYFEKIGVKVRFYMTRFVTIDDGYNIKQTYNGTQLPMAEIANRLNQPRNKWALYIQPIIAKDFADEFDDAFSFLISSQSMKNLYRILAEWSQLKEVDNFSIFGYPDFPDKEDYLIGFDRYRNKYQEYVKLGIIKSKEVLPEAMVFFHDIVLKENLSEFVDSVTTEIVATRNPAYSNINADNCGALKHPAVNPFFSWWMRLSANHLKDKINLINTNELDKDIVEIRRDLERFVDEYQQIVDAVTIKRLKDYLAEFGKALLFKYDIIKSSTAATIQITLRAYIESITNEITTYSEGDYYPTPDEQREKMDELNNRISTAVSNIIN